MTQETQNAWTPKAQDGGVFCSPRCGYKCKNVAHQRAVREAGLLCEYLGEGWEPHIWENGGWHYDAKKGPMRLHVSTCGDKVEGTYSVVGYSAEICSSEDRHQLWPHSEGQKADPKAAVAYTLHLARLRSEAIMKAVGEVAA